MLMIILTISSLKSMHRNSILGIDCYGIDYLADGLRRRLGFGETAVREEYLDAILHEVVTQLALEKSGE